MEDFRSMKWQVTDRPNSIAKKNWTLRISMILAFDNFGESYVTLTQSNTTSEIMTIYLRDLVR